jgi:hypothetical protein
VVLGNSCLLVTAKYNTIVAFELVLKAADTSCPFLPEYVVSSTWFPYAKLVTPYGLLYDAKQKRESLERFKACK